MIFFFNRPKESDKLTRKINQTIDKLEKRHFDLLQSKDKDLLRSATNAYDRQQTVEQQRAMFDRIMAYTSQNYNSKTRRYMTPINAYVGEEWNDYNHRQFLVHY